MPFTQLTSVKHRVVIGSPLPFNVRNADHTLLLARGHVILHAAQLQALFERGALVDLDELKTPLDRVREATAQQLPALWEHCMGRVGETLQHCSHAGFGAALDEVSQPVLGLVERDPDLAIFQVLRQDANAHTAYGLDHSVHTAITAFLVAQRLGWDSHSVQTVFKAALTMNVSMLELQGTLAMQNEPVSAEQRSAIHSHPLRSVEMLELAGITDPFWLQAVLQHHEADDGSGYPCGAKESSDFAALLRRADVYTTKLSPRRTRTALAADRAGRTMFMSDPDNSMTLALVKEFGVYPPGCFVRLVSGETAVVLKRGRTVTTPRVAVLTTANGAALTQPLPRDTALRENAIASIVGEHTVKAKPTPATLAMLAGA